MPATAAARHILFLNWRDTRNPEGGGSEVYTERIAAELVARGHRVTLLCAAHEGAPAEQVLPTDVHVLRRGGRHTVYLRAALTYLAGGCRLGRLASGVRGRPDLIVDVCNGVPFLSPLYARCPTVVVVHHVHREQWPVVFGDWRGRFGWWLESRVAPRVYRRCRYVTVSAATRDEFKRLLPGRIIGVSRWCGWVSRARESRSSKMACRATAAARSGEPRTRAWWFSVAWCRTSGSNTRWTPWPRSCRICPGCG